MGYHATCNAFAQWTVTTRAGYLHLARTVVAYAPDSINRQMLREMNSEWELRMLVDDWYETVGRNDQGHRLWTKAIGEARQILLDEFFGYVSVNGSVLEETVMDWANFSF